MAQPATMNMRTKAAAAPQIRTRSLRQSAKRRIERYSCRDPQRSIQRGPRRHHRRLPVQSPRGPDRHARQHTLRQRSGKSLAELRIAGRNAGQELSVIAFQGHDHARDLHGLGQDGRNDRNGHLGHREQSFAGWQSKRTREVDFLFRRRQALQRLTDGQHGRRLRQGLASERKESAAARAFGTAPGLQQAPCRPH